MGTLGHVTDLTAGRAGRTSRPGRRDSRDDLAEKAADNPWIEGLARAGLVARGVMYATVGAIALRIATGSTGEQADKQGALASLARQPLGKVLLVAVAVGFAGYATWRFIDAILDTDGEGSDFSGWARRAGDLARGLLYVSFFVTTVRIIVGASGDETDEADRTAMVLHAPLGRVVVTVVGLAIIGGGVYNGYRAVSRKYTKKLRTHRMSPTARKWVVAVATAGLLSRMVVYGLIGTFLVRAALRYDPNEAVGVDGALSRLADRPYGPWLLGLVAIGLFMYGLYSFVEARYRRLMQG